MKWYGQKWNIQRRKSEPSQRSRGRCHRVYLPPCQVLSFSPGLVEIGASMTVLSNDHAKRNSIG
jgi:hypothetical protein